MGFDLRLHGAVVNEKLRRLIGVKEIVRCAIARVNITVGVPNCFVAVGLKGSRYQRAGNTSLWMLRSGDWQVWHGPDGPTKRRQRVLPPPQSACGPVRAQCLNAQPIHGCSAMRHIAGGTGYPHRCRCSVRDTGGEQGVTDGMDQ
jgi:hypothetical protein